MTTITFEEFDAQFIVIPSGSSAAYLTEESTGLSYDTVGSDFQYIMSLVNAHRELCVWTIVETDGSAYSGQSNDEPSDDDDRIIAGFHPINALGYIVTKNNYSEHDKTNLEITI